MIDVKVFSDIKGSDGDCGELFYLKGVDVIYFEFAVVMCDSDCQSFFIVQGIEFRLLREILFFQCEVSEIVFWFVFIFFFLVVGIWLWLWFILDYMDKGSVFQMVE